MMSLTRVVHLVRLASRWTQQAQGDCSRCDLTSDSMAATRGLEVDGGHVMMMPVSLTVIWKMLLTRVVHLVCLASCTRSKKDLMGEFRSTEAEERLEVVRAQ